MGGLVAFKLSVKHGDKISGAILLCPALRDCYENIPYLKKLGRALGYLFPRLKIVPQDFKGMNKYENFEFMKKDEGRYLGNHPPGSAYILLKELDTLSESFKLMKTPYLCIQAGMDTAVDLFAPLDLEK
jgi:pimeloyl-ACP methyl ester carboxylesterase